LKKELVIDNVRAKSGLLLKLLFNFGECWSDSLDSTHIINYKLLFQGSLQSKDKYPDFKYIDILNSQLQLFQLKFTERHENRLSSKTIKVLLSNRKLTGRKRLAV
jgi:hypothetical protein